MVARSPLEADPVTTASVIAGICVLALAGAVWLGGFFWRSIAELARWLRRCFKAVDAWDYYNLSIEDLLAERDRFLAGWQRDLDEAVYRRRLAALAEERRKRGK
jgi:hypothetical protein